MIVPVPDGSPFPIENLPFGVFDRGDGARIGVALGDHVVDLRAASEAGKVPTGSAAALRAPDLNDYLELGRGPWQETRAAIVDLVGGEDSGATSVHGIDDVSMRLPFRSGDYVDFYSSIEHATNLGRMFRPDGDPLLPNWRHLPVGYHGRASTIVVSGTPIRRPSGQRSTDDGPVFGPADALDFELEVGFVTGPGNELGVPIDVDDVGDHVFGLVLVNDWSARDIQRWEYVPLGPFLGKSFATTISPWVVTLDALAPYMVPSPPQTPEPLPHLRAAGDWGVAIDLEVALSSERMRRDGMAPEVVSRTSFATMYWTMAQQVAHLTSNGTAIRPGDLCASGTVSGDEPGTYGSLVELTWGGRDPIELPDGTERRFLLDGDEVVLGGVCGGEGLPTIGFGSCRGTILP